MNHYIVEKFTNKLDRITISDYNGLNSPGLTCYLNSVLQVLFMTKDFREAIKRCCNEDSTAIDSHLESLFTVLENNVAETHNITETLGITDVYMQRDAAEYFEKILCLTNPDASKIFRGELNHKTTCLKCKERNNCRSFFWTLPLAVENPFGHIYSVEKGLKAFFKKENVCGDNKMYCNRCNTKQDAHFECEITQNPENLTLLLKRFRYDYKRRCYVKLHCEVDVPQTLHMESCMYDLYAIVNHFGNIMGGHYIAQIKSFETGAWYQFDDHTVKSVQHSFFMSGKKSLRSSSAYLLMYRKVSKHPTKTDESDQDAPFVHSDVRSERRRDGAERRDQLKDDIYNGGKYLRHLNGEVFKSDDETVSKKMTNSSVELKKQTNQRAACDWSHGDIWPQTDSVLDGDIYRPSLQTFNFAEPEKYEVQTCYGPNRWQHATNSENICHLNTRGTPDDIFKKTLRRYQSEQNSQKKRLTANEIMWETQSGTITKTGTKAKTDHGPIKNTVKLPETRGVKNKKEVVAEVNIEKDTSKQRRDAAVRVKMGDCDVKSSHVSSNGYSSSGPHSRSLLALKEPNECNSCNLCRKSSNLKSNQVKVQHVVLAEGGRKLEATQGENVPSLRGERNAKKSMDKVRKDPWRS
ncbi:ubiquitin carboxyl-terminal hydrolase 7 [Scomber japonicus]|uniref:ubiquitin carboxyl-terminal hydrolase 7 n=1 Tax=Scomber japonicus TaxID=13676 RepID=UPI0023063E4F|nr:ubiquitin carboxyl-terminal hydrolase 7 [Scomber japonicus]